MFEGNQQTRSYMSELVEDAEERLGMLHRQRREISEKLHNTIALGKQLFKRRRQIDGAIKDQEDYLSNIRGKE